MSKTRGKAAILISGSGSNLQSFIDKAASGEIDLDLCVVFSNNPDAFGLIRANEAGIATECLEHGAYPERESFDRAVADVLDSYSPDLIILAGFMRILSPWFVQHFEGRVLNIHPALLPAHPGLDTHQRVLDAGDKWHGSTVHFVTEVLDGGPLILQGRLAINPNETADELCARVQALEHQIYPLAAHWFGQGRLELKAGSVFFDGERLDGPIVKNH